MATYLALTTTNFQQNGYRIVCSGSDKQATRKLAEEIIGVPHDIYAQTEQRNLIVVSKSEARKYYGIGRRTDYYDY